MLTFAKTLIKKLPVFSRIVTQRDSLHLELIELKNQIAHERDEWQARLSAPIEDPPFAPSGHFYSPIPSLDEIAKDEPRIFAAPQPSIAGIDLNAAGQLALLNHFVEYYKEMPFQADTREGLRYCFENSAYSYSDAIMLYCMIRHLKPKRLIEAGSGHSSCVTLDTNEMFLGGSLETTFIEPYPQLLMSLIKDTDKERINIIPSRLQDVDLSVFDELQANDILFIDSTHVSKVNSDVNYIFFEILPRLASGVYIHFHDIFYPFEYPKAWIYEGRAWNEAYLLRSFLQYNSAFSVVLMNTFMDHFHKPFFAQNMPLCLCNPGGSIWIRKH